MGDLILSTAQGRIYLRVAGTDPASPALSATHTLTTGKATFGQVIPQGTVPAGYAIQVGILETQCDIKSTWDDGSARFAVLTCFPTETSDYSLSVVGSSSGTFTPTIPTASVAFSISGTTWTAALPTTVSDDPWLSGPLVREWRHVVTPLDPSANPHPWLRVYYDTRAYNDGVARLDIAVENCLDVTGATVVTYDVAITVDGSTVFAQSAVSHWYMARWRKVFGVGLTESVVTFDFEPLLLAKALPRFIDGFATASYATNTPQFEILKRGGNTFDAMGSVGGRPELAPYPDWIPRLLKYQTASQREYTIASGTLAGSWPIHLRKPNGDLVSIDDQPNFWLDSRSTSQYSEVPLSDRPKGVLTSASTGPLIPELAHTPSLAYVPYLLTGDRYQCDEMIFWANYVLIKSAYYSASSEFHRHRSMGIIAGGEVRAFSWSLRNLADAAAYAPDLHPNKSYLIAKVMNNLAFFDGYCFENTVNPLGWCLFTIDGVVNGVQVKQFSQWQCNFVAWAIDRANQQGFVGGKLLRDAMVAFQLKLYTSGPDYPREYASPYWPIVGIKESNGTVTYLATMDDFFEANFRNTDGTLAPQNYLGYYAIDARMSLLIAIEAGMSDAQEVHDWLVPRIINDVLAKPGWAIAGS